MLISRIAVPVPVFPLYLLGHRVGKWGQPPIPLQDMAPWDEPDLFPLGSQSCGWHEDASVPAHSLGTALFHARKGDKRLEEGPGQCYDGAWDYRPFLARDDRVPRKG